MTNERFSFKFVTEDKVGEVIINLDGSNATPICNIYVDILKSTVDIHLPFRITGLPVFYRTCQSI